MNYVNCLACGFKLDKLKHSHDGARFKCPKCSARYTDSQQREFEKAVNAGQAAKLLGEVTRIADALTMLNFSIAASLDKDTRKKRQELEKEAMQRVDTEEDTK